MRTGNRFAAIPIFTTVALISFAWLSAKPDAQAAPSPWSDPLPLVAPINSPFMESGASISADGLTMIFGTNRPCSDNDVVSDADLWVARRSSLSAPWQAQCLRINADGFTDNVPYLSPDGHWLYFVSDRPGSIGTQNDRRDVWVSRRRDVQNDQGWEEPINLGAPVNTDAPEGGPAYFVTREAKYFRLLPKEKLIFNSARETGSFDLWEVGIFNGMAFGPSRRLDEVDTLEFTEAGSTVSADGLELFFQRGLPGGLTDLFTATRHEPDERWSQPVRLPAPLNTAEYTEAVPRLSPDGSMLIFQSNRPGGLGSLDVWITTRTIFAHSR